MKKGLLCLIATILVVSFPVFARVNYDASSEQVNLEVLLPPDANFRVWHTTSPMKVIVDLDYYLEFADHYKIPDVALSAIRTSNTSPLGGTRLVMDFAYQLPDPKVTTEGDKLVVTLDKVFNRSQLNTVTTGVRYGHQRRGIVAGPLIVNYLDINLQNPNVQFGLMIGKDQIFGREYVSDMAKRAGAIAAVNGAFFAYDGRPLGLLVIDNEIISEPYARRTALGIGENSAAMGPVGFSGQAIMGNGASHSISGINRSRGQDELILYTPYFGSANRTNVYGLDVTVIDDRVVEINQGSVDIPAGGYVLSGHGKARDFLADLEIGEQISVQLDLEPDWRGDGISHIIGGGPRLVRDGEVYITSDVELFKPDVAASRAPRTALGITEDGRLLLVTVNGRQPGISVGMTLRELATLMIELGAYDAMNLDGGGSTTMVIREMVLNLPSDGIERPVSNGLLIITPESKL